MRHGMEQVRRHAVFAILVAASAACGGDAVTPPPVVAPQLPVGVPRGSVAQRVVVTTVTTGVRLDPDGYGILNDPWGADVGDGVTVDAPINGTTVIYLTSGEHLLGLIGVAENCRGDGADGRLVTVPPGAAETAFVFELVCG